jgi:hypothetical protein
LQKRTRLRVLVILLVVFGFVAGYLFTGYQRAKE